MTQKIVNVSEIEGLPKYAHDIGGMIWSGQPKETLVWVNIADLRALLDKSPSVSSEAVYQICIRETWLEITLEGYIKHRGVKRTLYTTPQPDRVAELEAKLKVASEALENIVKHFDLMGKSITDYSITYQIATEALAKIKD